MAFDDLYSASAEVYIVLGEEEESPWCVGFPNAQQQLCVCTGRWSSQTWASEDGMKKGFCAGGVQADSGEVNSGNESWNTRPLRLV